MIITILATGQKIKSTVKMKKCETRSRYFTANKERGLERKIWYIKIIETDSEIQEFEGLTELVELEGMFYFLTPHMLVEDNRDAKIQK